MNPTATTAGNAAETIKNLMSDLHRPAVVPIVRPDAGNEGEVLVVPKGMTVHSLEPFFADLRPAPLRRKGIAVLHDEASFIAHAVRFKDGGSAIFADPDPARPAATCVFDYHQAGPAENGGQRHGEHRGVYRFPVADAWKVWAEADGEALSHRDFAELIEDRIDDVIAPPVSADGEDDARLHTLLRTLGGSVAGPAKLVELSRGLKINEETRVKSAQNLSTGEVQIMWETEHRDGDNAPVKVPNLFLIAIPVFEGGPLYRIPVRLRYRLAAGRVSWTVRRYRPEAVFKDALDEALLRIGEATGLPVLRGTPEG